MRESGEGVSGVAEHKLETIAEERRHYLRRCAHVRVLACKFLARERESARERARESESERERASERESGQESERARERESERARERERESYTIAQTPKNKKTWSSYALRTLNLVVCSEPIDDVL